MKVLLDTNIIIHRETRENARKDIGLLFKWLDKLGYEKFVHSLTKDEAQKHGNPKIVESFMAKLTSYEELVPTPIHDKIQQYMDEHDLSQNDKNDSILLNEVVQQRVDILISEDKKIQKKAEIFKISAKVFTIEEFLYKANIERPPLINYKVLSIKKLPIGELNKDDPFWDNFKQDYQNFEEWLNNKSQEPSYVSQSENGAILAFLYLKVESEDENYRDINPIFELKKRLKIGTFKVVNTGLKLGERFLRIIFENALAQNVEEIYLTIFIKDPQHESLIALIEQWGFKYHGSKCSESGEEAVYVRDFSKQFDEENIKHTYPFISRNKRKFLVPIKPKFHTDLLPDSILSNEKPENFTIDKDHRNAIHKVYISRAKEIELKTGDIIIFYRTKQPEQSGYYSSVITTIGIVESVTKNINNIDTFMSLCRKRSVYNDNQLERGWNHNPRKRPFVVNFLYVYSFPIPYINLKKLIELEIISSTDDAPRTFREISAENFNTLLRQENVKDNYIID